MVVLGFWGKEVRGMVGKIVAEGNEMMLMDVCLVIGGLMEIVQVATTTMCRSIHELWKVMGGSITFSLLSQSIARLVLGVLDLDIMSCSLIIVALKKKKNLVSAGPYS